MKSIFLIGRIRLSVSCRLSFIRRRYLLVLIYFLETIKRKNLEKIIRFCRWVCSLRFARSNPLPFSSTSTRYCGPYSLVTEWILFYLFFTTGEKKNERFTEFEFLCPLPEIRDWITLRSPVSHFENLRKALRTIEVERERKVNWNVLLSRRHSRV